MNTNEELTDKIIRRQMAISILMGLHCGIVSVDEMNYDSAIALIYGIYAAAYKWDWDNWEVYFSSLFFCNL